MPQFLFGPNFINFSNTIIQNVSLLCKPITHKNILVTDTYVKFWLFFIYYKFIFENDSYFNDYLRLYISPLHAQFLLKKAFFAVVAVCYHNLTLHLQ